MASTYRLNRKGKLVSPYFYAKYKTADGSYACKSTGLTKKREAQTLAQEWEADQIKLQKKQLDNKTEIQNLVNDYVANQNKNGFKHERAIKLVAKIYAIGSGKELKIPTLKRYLAEWLIDKKAHVSASTYQTYKEAIASTARVYGSIGNKKLAILEEDDLKQIQRKLLAEAKSKGTTMRTLNYKMGVLIRAIKDARISKLIEDEIWAGIDPMPEQDSQLKVPFTLEEIQRLMRSATGEWKGMILIGAETGLRISNIANLKWSNINLDTRVIRAKMVKQDIRTNVREIKILSFPIKESMMNCLKFFGENRKGFVFPEIAKIHKDTRSKQFNRIMKDAKVDKEIYLDDYERNGRRSFHSLRHYFNTACANSDIDKDTRKQYSGHSSDEANAIYAKKDPELMRKELDKLPEIKWEVAQ